MNKRILYIQPKIETYTVGDIMEYLGPAVSLCSGEIGCKPLPPKPHKKDSEYI